MGAQQTPDADAAAAGTPAAAEAFSRTAAPGSGRRDEGHAAGRAPADVIATELMEDCRFDALRTALYHASRRNFFETCHRWLLFAVVLGGSGTIGVAFRNDTTYLIWAGLLTTTAGAIDLVFDLAGKARESEALVRRAYGILADMEEDPARDPRRFRAALVRLYGDERPPMRAADAIAYNAAQLSLYGDKAKRLKLSWWESRLRHFWPFNRSAFDVIPSTGPASSN